jgi:hypothetical protein
MREKQGKPKRRPGRRHANKGYASKTHWANLRKRGITPRIAIESIKSADAARALPLVAEWIIGWLHSWKNAARVMETATSCITHP